MIEVWSRRHKTSAVVMSKKSEVECNACIAALPLQILDLLYFTITCCSIVFDCQSVDSVV